ncbi:MAG TPA: hypothetical protein VF814_06975 [Casimicrobiaceae bacterium]
MSEIERDLDAAWRAASREEPPATLDAAIHAEARRAVGAAPGRKRNKHWWYPLAAAATVAVLAIGIARLTPPEQVAPTLLTEQSAAPRSAASEAKRQAAPADTSPAASPPAATQPQPLPREPRVASAAIERERAAAPPIPMAKKQAPPPKEEAPAREQLAAAPSEKLESSAAPAASSAPPAPPAARGEREVGGLAAGQVARRDEAKAKDVDARDREEWIKRIRELKSAGRIDDAAKELAAFRAAFGEQADALLPPELRTWAPGK